MISKKAVHEVKDDIGTEALQRIATSGSHGLYSGKEGAAWLHRSKMDQGFDQSATPPNHG